MISNIKILNEQNILKIKRLPNYYQNKFASESLQNYTML